MSMIAELHSLSDENRDRIIETPYLIGKLVNPARPYIYHPDTPPDFMPETIMKLGEDNKFHVACSQPNLPADYTELELSLAEFRFDLDKAWHGVHYCLTKDIGEGEHPLGFLLYGGIHAGDIEIGLAPARSFSAAQTRVIEGLISDVSVEDLKINYDPQKMTDVYPDIWNNVDEDNFDYIRQNFEDLKRFLTHCQSEKIGFVTYIV